MREHLYRVWVKGFDTPFHAPQSDWSLSLHDTGHRLLMWCSDGIADELHVESIEQYIGMNSKDGVRIFEGDILGNGELVPPREVIFENGSYRLRDGDNHANQVLVRDTARRLEVMGNTHSTLKLLTETLP